MCPVAPRTRAFATPPLLLSGIGEIRGLVPLLPLDVAADARTLLFRDGSAGEHGVERGAEVAARHRLAAVGTALVELAAVNELPVFVEQEEIGRAGGRI